MSPWKSRWSWLKFVNTSTAKRTRSSRCSSDACDDASIAHERSPASSISRNVRCRSIASGVVRSTPRRSPPTRASTVPSRPGRRPAAARIAYRRNDVVVFPLVPVTAATWSSSVGCPKNSSAATAIAARASATCSCGTSSCQRPLDDERDRAVRHRLGREVVAVGMGARDAEEERARRRVPRVVDEVAHLDRRLPRRPLSPRAQRRGDRVPSSPGESSWGALRGTGGRTWRSARMRERRRRRRSTRRAARRP